MDKYFVLIDLNFGGCGWMFIDEDGYYVFCIVKFGVYLWCNWVNNWCLVYIYVLIFGRVFV